MKKFNASTHLLRFVLFHRHHSILNVPNRINTVNKTYIFVSKICNLILKQNFLLAEVVQ